MDRKRWHKERVAPEFAVKGSSTSNDRGDLNGGYQCKMVAREFIEGDSNGRKIFWEWNIILRGNCRIATGDTSARWWGRLHIGRPHWKRIFVGGSSLQEGDAR